MQSLDELKDPATRSVVAAAIRKDTEAGVPFDKLVRIRMTIAQSSEGYVASKGFSFNILVSDHAGFLAAVNPRQRAAYRRFLATLAVSTDEQIAAFTPRVRILLGHDESDPLPGLNLLDAQLFQDTRTTPSSPFAAFLRDCNSNDGPDSTCVSASPGRADQRANATSPAVRPTPPFADDWSRIQVGDGPVLTQIRNASDHDLTVRIKDRSGRVVAQIGLGAHSNASAHLPHGSLQTLLRMLRGGQVSYFRGPGIEVPPHASQLNLTLEGASISNLTPIDGSEFNR
ncbi:MAG: hypothetical protein H7X95_11075 [Deltaproteobacteria bacterium]|nr:hypothetical protein [Deltaproteobacteria bacterium]